ncbi:MAG TPA: hypothetical protein VKO61_01710 [Candidatus Paceibacterota bacterium]|nr:hypothetical protein [Candidatus Paceibacterota bacterium]
MNNVSNILISAFILLLVGFFAFSPLVFASQEGTPDSNSIIWEGVTCNQQGEGPCDFCDMIKVISNIVNFLTRLAYIVAAAAIVAGGIMMMISGGNEKRFSKGKSLITNAVIGVVITLTAWIIVNTLFHILTGDEQFIWSEIVC